MTYLYCKRCLTSRTGDVLGAPCRTQGCGGIIEEQPTFDALVDDLPWPMTCNRRMFQAGPWEHAEGLDRWRKFKSNGDRVCSFCGSLHPVDFFRLVESCANAPDDAAFGSVGEVERSDKPHKVYVHQPGVRNAMEGGIKFYTHHLLCGEEFIATPDQRKNFEGALAASNKRFGRCLTVGRPAPRV